jgi:hypothetical protein
VLLTIASFAPLVHQRFALRAGGITVELELVEVQSLGKAPRADMREPFSLLFAGPLSPMLSQGSYPCEHASLGAHELFLVPIGRDPQRASYQAIFT